MSGKRSWRNRWSPVLILIFVFAFIALIAVAGVIFHRYSQRKICSANMHALAGAAILYADKTGEAPRDIAEIVNSDYFGNGSPSDIMQTLPVNPYTRQPIRQLKFGDTPTLGDFFYLPGMSTHTERFAVDSTEVEDGCLVIMFGNKRTIPFYFDIDENGIADPVVGFFTMCGCSLMADGSSRFYESPEETLTRHGYTRPLDEPLPDAL